MPMLRYLLTLLLALGLAAPALGQGRHDGTLGAGDETLTSGEYADSYTFGVAAGQWIEVTMRSDDLDSYIILRPPSCGEGGTCDDQFDNDDFFPGGGSFLWAEAAEGGTWEVLATSSAPGETGAYTVEIQVHDDGEGPATRGVMLDGERIENGLLEEGDATLNSGEFNDGYGFVGREGDHIVVDLRSTEFDPYLILQMPGDHPQADNDDWEGARDHARIEYTLPADGMYRVLVTTYTPGEQGAYDLQITPGGGGGTPPADGASGKPPAGGDAGGGGDPFTKD